jgi:hypothetical protein
MRRYVVLLGMLMVAFSSRGVPQEDGARDFQTGGKLILHIFKDKRPTTDRILLRMRLLNQRALWSGYCEIIEFAHDVANNVVTVNSHHYRVTLDPVQPFSDELLVNDMENISVHDSLLSFDLHRDMDHVMKIRAKFKQVTSRLFAITQVYGAELDFGMAAQRDTATVIEWKSSDDVMIELPTPIIQ